MSHMDVRLRIDSNPSGQTDHERKRRRKKELQTSCSHMEYNSRHGIMVAMLHDVLVPAPGGAIPPVVSLTGICFAIAKKLPKSPS